MAFVSLGDYCPRWVAVLGVQAYRIDFNQSGAQIGRQQDTLAGTRVWLLPSPSGANGSYPLVDLVSKLREFYDAVSSDT